MRHRPLPPSALSFDDEYTGLHEDEFEGSECFKENVDPPIIFNSREDDALEKAKTPSVYQRATSETHEITANGNERWSSEVEAGEAGRALWWLAIGRGRTLLDPRRSSVMWHICNT